MFIIVFVNLYHVFDLIVIIVVSVSLPLHAAQTALLYIHMLCRDLCWLQTEKHDFLVLLSLSAQHKFDT